MTILNGLTIRDATTSDASAMARARVDTWRVAYRGIIATDFLDALSYADSEDRFRNTMGVSAPDEEFMVAENTESVIGFVIFGPERAVAARDRGEIYAIYVRPECQGNGIGLMLMQAAAERLIEHGIRSLTIWTLEKGQSRQFYEHLGGRLASSKLAYIGGVGYEHVAYCWSDISQLVQK